MCLLLHLLFGSVYQEIKWKSPAQGDLRQSPIPSYSSPFYSEALHHNGHDNDDDSDNSDDTIVTMMTDDNDDGCGDGDIDDEDNGGDGHDKELYS